MLALARHFSLASLAWWSNTDQDVNTYLLDRPQGAINLKGHQRARARTHTHLHTPTHTYTWNHTLFDCFTE